MFLINSSANYEPNSSNGHVSHCEFFHNFWYLSQFSTYLPSKAFEETYTDTHTQRDTNRKGPKGAYKEGRKGPLGAYKASKGLQGPYKAPKRASGPCTLPNKIRVKLHNCSIRSKKNRKQMSYLEASKNFLTA